MAQDRPGGQGVQDAGRAPAPPATATPRTWPECWAKPLAAGKTDTFLDERYLGIVCRFGNNMAIVAVGRSLVVIVRHPSSDSEARFHNLGSDFYDNRLGPERIRRTNVPGGTP